METLLFSLHIVLWPLCLSIIGLILLQGGAGDLSSSFGGGGQLDSTLGVGAGRKMSKLTAWLVGSFMVLLIAMLGIQPSNDLSKAAGKQPSSDNKPESPTGAMTDTSSNSGMPGAPEAPKPPVPSPAAPAIGPMPTPTAPVVPSPEGAAPAAAPAATTPPEVGTPAAPVAPVPAAPSPVAPAPRSTLTPE